MRAIAVFVFWIMAACLGQAQTTMARPQQSQPATPPATSPGSSTRDQATQLHVFRTRVEEVNLVFTVTDKRGKFVKDLTQDEFKILDNNRPPKEVLNFEAQTDLPLLVGLLIDASGSIRERFLFEQKAAIEFLQTIIRTATDKAFVLAFDQVSNITQDFTNDLELLSRGIKQIRPGGGTAIWDAVYYACRDKFIKHRETAPVRRAIILISDGEDNQSRVLRQEALEMVQRAEVIVYVISTSVSDIPGAGDKNLQTLAEATGGRAFFPFKLGDLSDAFGEVENELRSQYAVAYKPADFVFDGQFRPIQIVAENKKLKVRTRQGYFAPKE